MNRRLMEARNPLRAHTGSAKSLCAARGLAATTFLRLGSWYQCAGERPWRLPTKPDGLALNAAIRFFTALGFTVIAGRNRLLWTRARGCGYVH